MFAMVVETDSGSDLRSVDLRRAYLAVLMPPHHSLTTHIGAGTDIDARRAHVQSRSSRDQVVFLRRLVSRLLSRLLPIVFSPIEAFPGPHLPAITSFYKGYYASWKNGMFVKHVEELHRIYEHKQRREILLRKSFPHWVVVWPRLLRSGNDYIGTARPFTIWKTRAIWAQCTYHSTHGKEAHISLDSLKFDYAPAAICSTRTSNLVGYHYADAAPATYGSEPEFIAPI
ncbi:hypothetical protein BDZ89DRAFT_1225041 [Hymenopellis radicata]|nr:hypothetical protein BDZ89DRAFT_1225041 [Hymenopellis radicata]